MFLLLLLEGFFFTGYLTGGNSFPKPLNADEERAALQAYTAGSDDAKNILIEHNLRLVAHVAKKYANHAKESEDLISVGTIGLIKAITSFNPNRNIRLATYAAKCIDNEILMHLRASKKFAGDIYLQDILGTDREGNEVKIEDKIAINEDSIDNQVSTKILIKDMYQTLRRVLHGREKTVIELRYGLEGNDELTQREISKQLNISRSYVSRIEKKALGKLRDGIDDCPA